MLNDAEMDDLRWKADLIGGCVPVRPEELRELLDEIARLRADLDRRPEITPEDAALVRDVAGLVGVSRVYRALMVHAAKAVKP